MINILQPLSIQQYRHEKGLHIQEKWRQKQIDTFYRTGRPIFAKDEYKFRYHYYLNSSTKNKTLFKKNNL
jgi:hypothetical protein